jgi:hypothetical protein
MPLSGSETLSSPDTSPPAKSTSVQLSMFEPTTSEDSPSATSSPGSASGPTRSGKPDGLTIGRPGQDPARASRGARPDAARVSMMSAISGRTGRGSLASAGLALSLASRLQTAAALLGSTLFALTWKQRVTPSGRSIPALRALGRRTSGSDSTSWPTPTSARTGDYTRDGRTGTERPSSQGLVGWPTPVANDDNKSVEAHLAMKRRMGERDGTGANRTAITSLAVTAKLAAWPSPRTGDCKMGGETQADRAARGAGGPTLTDAAKLAPWPTTQARDGMQGGLPSRATGKTRHGSNLDDFAHLASWATPMSNDVKGPQHGPSHTEEGRTSPGKRT